MARIFCEEDCGNAPKKAILRDFNIAIANKDLDYLLEWISDDVVWNKVGQSTATGKAQVADAFREIVWCGSGIAESHVALITRIDAAMAERAVYRRQSPASAFW